MFWITFPAIDINASDIKALYRRSQALEKLGKLDQAFKDAQKCATIEPRNKNFQETLRRLGANIQDKVNAGGAVLGSQMGCGKSLLWVTLVDCWSYWKLITMERDK